MWPSVLLVYLQVPWHGTRCGVTMSESFFLSIKASLSLVCLATISLYFWYLLLFAIFHLQYLSVYNNLFPTSFFSFSDSSDISPILCPPLIRLPSSPWLMTQILIAGLLIHAYGNAPHVKGPMTGPITTRWGVIRKPFWKSSPYDITHGRVHLDVWRTDGSTFATVHRGGAGGLIYPAHITGGHAHLWCHKGKWLADHTSPGGGDVVGPSVLGALP